MAQRTVLLAQNAVAAIYLRVFCFRPMEIHESSYKRSREEVRLLADTSNNKLIWSLFSIEERRRSHMNQPLTELPLTELPLTELKDNALIALALAGEGECFSILMNRHLTALKSLFFGPIFWYLTCTSPDFK